MLGYLALQAEAGAAVLAAVVVAVIIGAIFYGLQRRSVSEIRKSLQPLRSIDPNIQQDVSRIGDQLRATCEDLKSLEKDHPSTNEVAMMHQNVQNLCADFADLKRRMDGEMGELKQGTADDMHRLRRGTAEDLERMRNDVMSRADAAVIEKAGAVLSERSVSREEFDALKGRVAKMVGSDMVADRLAELTSLFDSKQIKTLNWQCRLIKLLNGGLAPDAEEDRIVSEGIPLSSYNKFLKRLEASGVAEQKSVSAFYMSAEYEWLYGYVENPDQLQKLLEGTVRKEKEYQRYVRDNLELVERGLLLESPEYELATGKIDLLCRDGSGKAVGLELKYPEASAAAKRQIAGYRSDYEKKAGAQGARFFVVAPKIPDKLKEMLREDGLEYREIPFEGD